MFIGEFQHSLDTKNRVILPARFREKLGDNFVVTKGLDNCLFIYTLEEWNVVEKKLSALPTSNKDARAYARFFFSGAIEAETDKQGRMLIPSNLKEYAHIEKDVVIIGVSSRIEIWSTSQWQKYIDEADMSIDEVSAKMSELGI